jgi:pimeloyl-ACP methyl ester carboxylesterase
VAPDPPGRLFDIGGRRMHLIHRGEGRPAIVLEAGWWGTGLGAWRPVLDQLAEISTVCAYDRPGYGWSDPQPQPLTLDGVARDLRRLLEAAVVTPPYVLVGHSLGGLYVRRFTELFPQDVAGLVLMDATHPGQKEDFMAVAGAGFRAAQRMQDALGPWLVPVLMRVMAKRLIATHFPELTPPERRALISLHLTRTFRRTAFAELESTFAEATSLSPRLPVQVPLLVLAAGRPLRIGGPGLRAARDRHLQEQVALSDRGRFAVVEESGHLLAHEAPQRVVDFIREVVGQARGGGAPSAVTAVAS